MDIKKSDVEFVVINNKLEVIFDYNEKIIDIMRRFKGKFILGPPARWQFPLAYRDMLAKELRLYQFTVDACQTTLNDCIIHKTTKL